jgi:hypothetical protein
MSFLTVNKFAFGKLVHRAALILLEWSCENEFSERGTARSGRWVVVVVTPGNARGTPSKEMEKFYAPEKIDQSLQNFFQRRNLDPLRELALREIAGR